MEEIAQSNSLNVPARGFCNMVANDSSSIGEARAKKSPLTSVSTFPNCSGVTRTIIGSNVQLSSYVPEEMMRGLPIALPWKILEKVDLPCVAQSTATTLTSGDERKDIEDGKERSVMEFSGTSLDGANYQQDRPQSPEWLDQNNNEDSGLGDILLTTLRSSSPAEIVFGERATVQDSPNSMLAHAVDFPFYPRMMSARQASLPNNVVAAPFIKTNTAFLTIEDTGYRTTDITKLANTTDSATQISRTSTVDSATQIGNDNITDFATQINNASTTDSATLINKARTTDSVTQVSIVSTKDSATQNSKASTVRSATQTKKTSTALEATTQVATTSGSIAIQCSLQGFTSACSQSTTSTKSTGVICSGKKAHFSAQFDSKLIAESVKINEKITDFTVDLVKRYTTVSKGEFNIAMIENQIRAEVGQFLLKIQDPNHIREVHVDSSNANDDKCNISARNLTFSEDESHKSFAEYEAPTEQNTENQESDFKGFVDMPDGYKSLNTSDLSQTDLRQSFEAPTITDADASDMESDEHILVHNDLSNISNGTTDSDWNVPDVFVPLVELESIDWVVKDDGWSRWIIGNGCYASVFWAKYEAEYGPTTDVAIKVMNDPDCDDDIVREAKILVHLQDTDVLPQFFGYLNIGTEDEPNICLVQQMFGDGRTIAHFLTDDDTRLDQRDWMSICIQLAKGLRKIHAKDIVLNDLKENNVLLDDSILGNPVMKFIDMGISTYTHGVSCDLTDEEIKYLPHIAPEIKYLKMASSYLSDIYSLGTIFTSISKEVGITELADVADACTRLTPEERLSHETIIEYLTNVREEMGLV